MHKKAGFTLIELMIVVAIMLIIASIFLKTRDNATKTPEQRHTQCIDGVKFTKANPPVQILNASGQGISCNNSAINQYENNYENTWHD